MKTNTLACLKMGAPWRPEYEELGCWGGWIDYDEAGPGEDGEGKLSAKQALLRPYAKNGDGSWIKEDYVRGGVMRHTIWFIPPRDVYDRVFGPKFNEWGEIAP